jgi:hypothetical protein
MQRTFDFPRARGGRSPQIGPGTFDGRSSGQESPPPPVTAFAWSPGPLLASPELWCFSEGFQAGEHDDPWYLHLDQVPEPLAFVPPPGSSPTGLATIDALKLYARNRYFDLYSVLIPVSGWFVHVAQPVPAETGATNRKLTDGVYRVKQLHRGPTPEPPRAWVWVSGSGSREIWLYYRPNEADGFHFVGTVPGGSQVVYGSTSLEFVGIPPYQGPWDPIGDYFASIEKFRTTAATDSQSPVGHPDDLVLHDLRVQEYSEI